MTIDFLVIGAGVVGLSTAYHLKRSAPGSRVLALERGARIASGNSARSAALFRNLFSSKTSRALAEASIDYYMELGEKIGLKANGYLWTFSEKHWNESRNAIRALSGEARDAELFDADALARIYRFAPADGRPYPRPHAGLLGRRCGSLSAMALAEHYAREFAALGGIILTGREARPPLASGARPDVPAWAYERLSAIVDSSGERHEAGTIVATSGCWLQDLLGPSGIATGIYPKKRQLFGIKLQDTRLVLADGVDPAAAPNLILPSGSVYLKPVLARGLLIAGCADNLGRAFELPYGPCEKAAAEEPYFRSAVEPVLRAVFPALDAACPGPLPLATSWAGHYDYYWPDRNPVVEAVGGLVWVGGSSGSGIMKADSIGRIAAARARGEPTAELADGYRFQVSNLSLRERSVDREGLVL